MSTIDTLRTEHFPIQTSSTRAAPVTDAASLQAALTSSNITIPQLLRQRAAMHGDALALRTRASILKLDARLIEAAEAVAGEKKMRGGLDPALEADASGPDGASWSRLVDLMQLAAEQAFAKLIANPSPQVLLRLGLLALLGVQAGPPS